MNIGGQQKQNNKNRPPSELEIKTMIFGKKGEDSDDDDKKVDKIKDSEDRKVLALIASDSGGEHSEKDEGDEENPKKDKTTTQQAAAEDGDQEDDYDMPKQELNEEEETKRKKKEHVKRLRDLLTAQNEMLEGKETTTLLKSDLTGGTITKMGLLTAGGGAATVGGGTVNQTQSGSATSGKTKKQQFAKTDVLSRMEKWDEADRNHPNNQKFLPLKDFKGIIEERGCTNIVCLIIWVLLNAVFLFCAALAFKSGVPNRLSNGNDFRGDICGVGMLSDRAYQYFAVATLDIQVSICVSKCPSTTGQDICLYNINGIIYPNEWDKFCYQQLASVYLGRYCIPKEPLNRQSVDQYLSTTRNTVKRLSSDLNLTLDLIFIGMFVGILLSFSLQLVMRVEKRVPFLIWGCIMGSFVCFCTMSYLFYLEYKRLIKFYCLLGLDKHSCGGQRAYLFYNLYWMVLIVAGIYMLVVIKLFNRINLAIGFIKASSKVVTVLGQLNSIPFISVGFSIAIGVTTLLACIYALTIGDVVLNPTATGAIDNDKAKSLEYNTYSIFIILTLFYMFYNWQNFTLGVNNMITSFALCIWFFSKKKDTVQIPIAITLKRIFRYHIGTVSLYILIEPVLRIPKLIIDLLDKIMRSLPQQSQFVRYMQGCFSCCLNFNGSFLRYISLHSFVQTSLFGDGYGLASKKAFFLINRHKEKLKDLDFLITFMIFQIKLSCSLFIAVMVYIYISNGSTTPFMQSDLSQVESPILPATVVFVVCYQIADIFQGSFNMACKTIIQCYFVDKEMFVGEQRFVEKFIRDFMEFYAKEDLTTFKLKSQKQAVITQKVKNKLIKDTVKKNLHNEFEAKHVDVDLDKKGAISGSDEDDEDKKKSDDSDSYIIEGEDSDPDSDDSDGLGIGKRDPKKAGTTTLNTQPVQIRPTPRQDAQASSNVFINDNMSMYSAGDIPLRAVDETMRSSGMSFFDVGKSRVEGSSNNNGRLGTGSSGKTKVINLNRAQQNAKQPAKMPFAKQM